VKKVFNLTLWISGYANAISFCTISKAFMAAVY
jgi:hypothetical protein